MAEAKSNIALFNSFVGVILEKLYTSFPVCNDISTAEIVNSSKQDATKEKNILVCSETLFWLRDSGFITFVAPEEKALFIGGGIEAYNDFTCVVLTAKGLEILKQSPSSIKANTTLGEKLSEAVEKGFASKVSELVGLAISGSLKFG